MNPSLKKYGITENKIALLNMLEQKADEERRHVEQKQVVVNGVTAIMQYTQSFLGAAETERVKTYANRSLVNELTQEIKNLENITDEVCHEMQVTTTKSLAFVHELKSTANRLICAAELLDKMTTYLIRKKSLNPLISDDLIATTGKAGNDANHAVSAMLTAMETAVAAVAGNQSSLAAATSIKAETKVLHMTVAHNKEGLSLTQLYQQACDHANSSFNEADTAAIKAALELNAANLNLNKTKTSLSSFQAALAAACNAAQTIQSNQQA